LLIGNQGMKHGDSDTALTDDTASLLRQLLLGNQGMKYGDTDTALTDDTARLLQQLPLGKQGKLPTDSCRQSVGAATTSWQ
jgi:hypothetical protein